jgi:hypothetical protein
MNADGIDIIVRLGRTFSKPSFHTKLKESDMSSESLLYLLVRNKDVSQDN